MFTCSERVQYVRVVNSSGKSQAVPIRAGLATNGSVSGGAIGLQQLPQSSTGLQTVTIRGGQAILTDGRGGQTILGDGRGGQTILGDSRGGQAILGDIRSGQQGVVARQVTSSVQGIKSVVPSSVHKGEYELQGYEISFLRSFIR